jgi:hypothetical protein
MSNIQHGLKGEITGIQPEARGRDGLFYIPVFFKVWSANGVDRFSARSWICPSMNNYVHWKGKLKVGNVLGNLTIAKTGNGWLVNADHPPTFISAPPQQEMLL